MATTKITDLTAYTDPVNTDVLPIVDVTSDVTKKVSIANVMKNASLGTNSLPGISFDGDPNTGIYSPGADQVAFTTGGTARLTSSTTALSSTLPIDVPLGAQGTPSLTFTGDLNTGIYSPGADQVAISTNGTAKLTIGSAQSQLTHNLRLDTTNANAFVLVRSNVATGGAGASELLLGNTSADARGYVSYNHANDSLAFGANGGERLRITSAGLVGIGTSSPGFKLDVNGEVAFSPNTAGKNTFYFTTNASNDASLFLKSDTTNKVNIQANGVSYFNGGNVGVGTSTPSAPLSFAASTGRKIGFYEGTQGYSIGVESSEFRFVTDAAGIFTFRNGGTYSSSTEYMRIDASGRLGVGTTSPSAALHVAAANNSQLFLAATDANATTIIIDTDAGASERVRINNKDGALTFDTNNNAERARIDSSGRLLVGTSSAVTPYAGILSQVYNGDLTVNTFANVQGYYGFSFVKSRGSGTSNVIVQNNDNVGATRFWAADGSNYIEAANIRCDIDGTPGVGDMPGRIVLSTTLDGANSPTEALRITNDRVVAYNQPAPTSKSAAATLTVAELKTGIVQYTGAAATLTLPTGTLTEGGFSGIYNNMTFEWSVINTGSGTCTIGTDTGHTIVGSATVAAGDSGRFASRRTTGNTFVSYRLS